MQDRRDVIIVGAGIIGLCSALSCARRGLRVTVVDRAPRQRDGCSFGNAGMIVPSHFIPLAAPGMVTLGLKWMLDPESPFYIRPRPSLDLLRWGLGFFRAASAARVDRAAPVLRDLSLLSRQCYEELGFDIGLVKKGLLMLCKEERTLEEEAHVAQRAEALGIPAQVLDARQTAAADPGVTMYVHGSVFYPLDCHLSPSRLMTALETELEKMGAELLHGHEVQGWEKGTRNGRALLTGLRAGNRLLSADEYVIAAGVWSDEMAQHLGLRLTMQAGKGYSLTLTSPRRLPELCSICTEARLAVTPMDGALRVGGTMELAGMDESISHRRVRGIIRSFPKYFPDFTEADFSGLQPWSGLRPVPPDGLPYLGRTRLWANLTVATGHAMMGLSLAAATGRIVADFVTDSTPPLDLALLSPDR
jgi:D-amino-acid dehydrogenase